MSGVGLSWAGPVLFIPFVSRSRARSFSFSLDGIAIGAPPQESYDRISALSDDMILLVLSRLGSVLAAARTGLLSLFHRVTLIELDVGLLSIGPPPAGGEFPALENLSLAGYILDLGTLLSRCPRLRVLGVTFRDANDPSSLHAALAALETAVAVLGITVSLLGIETCRIYVVNAAGFGPLLRSMARPSPRKLMITQKFGGHEYGSDVFRGHIETDLPCFHSATSIEMDLLSTVRFTPLPDGEFSALDRLSLPWRCSIPDLDSLVSRCPRLRVLKVALATGDVTVHSASLQDLSVYGNMECRRIDIVAPVLKKLTLIVWTRSGRELSVSISAPMVEKVLWQRGYSTSAPMLGFWRINCARLESRQAEEDTRAQIPRVHALWLEISCTAKDRTRSR
ncbi:hypothetical protein ACQ4PT_036488 [Festuca glaucescens]